jgi:hypothetical protein
MYLIKLSARKMYEGVKVYLHCSWPQYWVEMRGQLHAPASLTPGNPYSLIE